MVHGEVIVAALGAFVNSLAKNGKTVMNDAAETAADLGGGAAVVMSDTVKSAIRKLCTSHLSYTAPVLMEISRS